MALPHFAYCRPTTVEEVIVLLQEHGPATKILAGGQTLIPLLNTRLIQPSVVIDLNEVEGLRGIAAIDGMVRIGAMSRHREIECSALLKEACPLLPAAANLIGHSHIRNRGTIGGSVAHADPAAEYPVALLALEAKIEVTGAGGQRRVVPATDFFLGPLMTALDAAELVTAVHVPNLEPDFGWSFEEMTVRSGEFATVCVAVMLKIEDGRIAAARLAIGGATTSPVRLKAAEASLLGQRPGTDAWFQAGQVVAKEIDAADDPVTSAAYRHQLASVYTEKCLRTAAARWEG